MNQVDEDTLDVLIHKYRSDKCPLMRYFWDCCAEEYILSKPIDSRYELVEFYYNYSRIFSENP
jgi:hypothetical protein